MTDLRNGFRSLLNNPGFSSVAVLTLAVCIASNAAIFTVYDQLVVHPLTVPAPSSLVAIWSRNAAEDFYAPALSWPRFDTLRRTARSFSSMGVSAADSFALTSPGEAPLQLNGLRVSGAFFKTLGVLPGRGRDFTPEEDVPHGPNVCILSHELWLTRFGGRESIVGEVIHLNGQSWQVVGIMPPRLTPPFRQVDVFAPRVFEVGGLTPQQIEAGAGYTQPIARLGPGLTLAEAASELQALGQGYQSLFPGRVDAKNVVVPRDFVESVAGSLRPTFYTLLGAVGFVLLIACANVASLFIGQLSGRQRELAVKQSLGASRAVIVRELLTESLIVAVTAGVMAAELARWELKGIELLAQQLPPGTIFELSWRAWTFIAGVAMASALMVGLVPALHASRMDLVTVLQDATRGSSSGRGGRLRSSLIVAEVALSVVLLVGASLLLESFVSLARTPPGFDPSGVATAFVGVPADRHATPAEQADFFERVIDQIRRDPRTQHAAASIGLPIPGFVLQSPYSVLGRPILPLPMRPLAVFQVVSEDYFATLSIPIVMGRAFDSQDREGRTAVCIVNHAFASRLFPNESPLGHILLRGRNADAPQTIVGVIGDTKTFGLNQPAPDEIYYPLRQLGTPALNITVRTAGDPAVLQSAIRLAVAAVDHDQPISLFQPLDTLLAQSLGTQRMVATLTAGFAVIALVLATIGLYSVVAYAVAQRTNEIGIRMALGAKPGQVVGLIMGGGLKLVAFGLGFGLAGAVGASRLIRTLLSNVQSFDPLLYGTAAVFFGVVAIAACLVPSLRASRIDPVVALSRR
jgi:predicted permease